MIVKKQYKIKYNLHSKKNKHKFLNNILKSNFLILDSSLLKDKKTYQYKKSKLYSLKLLNVNRNLKLFIKIIKKILKNNISKLGICSDDEILEIINEYIKEKKKT